MRAVLGIDASWTAHNPSGVAVAVGSAGGWRIAAAASSFEQFGIGHISKLAAQLVRSAEKIAENRLSLVTVDMPLSRLPIVGRRASDKEVSSVYGSRKCATHSPSAVRPGPISDGMRSEFEALGFPLLTCSVSSPGLAEVYPHPALVELMGAPERLRYKLSRARLYWPELSPLDRRKKLFGVWDEVVAALEQQIKGVASALPAIALDGSGRELKAFEDTLDAIVCCWVGICMLEGRAKGYGDADSAIWIPCADKLRR